MFFLKIRDSGGEYWTAEFQEEYMFSVIQQYTSMRNVAIIGIKRTGETNVHE